MSLFGSSLTRCTKVSCIINARFIQIHCNRIYNSQCRVISRSFSSKGIQCIHRNVVVQKRFFASVTSLKNISVIDNTNEISNSGLKRRFCVSGVCRLNLTMGKRKRQTSSNRNESCTTSSANKDQVEPESSSRHGSKMRKLQPLSKVPTRINLVVIGTGGPGASQSLLVTTEYSRYMFNCGEGTQRLAAMSRSLRVSAFAKLAGLEHVFITHKSWENTGGLLGMAMTLEGQKNPEAKVYINKSKTPQGQNSNGLPQITVHGPAGVENIAMMAKKFSVHANMNIVRHEGEFKDTALTITPIPFYKQTAEISKLDERAPASAVRQRRGSSSTTAATGVAYAYLCKAQPLLPKINVEKCLDAGITIGPMVGCLQRGESVVLDDGRVVYPEQVTDTVPTDNRPFLIVECPNQDFLPSLRECPKLQPYLSKSDNSLAVIVHMTPADVFNSIDYQSWMSRFHDSTDHMVINREAGEVDLTRVRDHQARLNIVSQEVFPLLPDIEKNPSIVDIRSAGCGDGGSIEQGNGDTPSKDSVLQKGDPQPKESVLQKRGQVVKACAGLHYVYRGKEGVGFQIETDEFKCKELQEEFLDITDVQDQLAVLRETVPATSVEENEADDEENLTKYPKVTFLGTGSSEPNLIRSQSCVVVQVSKHSVIILDCGEDSYGQLYRFFGKAKTSQILKKIKAIFISHLHADHHLGLFSILKERKIAFDERKEAFTPAFVIAPIQMRRWLRFYHTELEPVTHLFRFVKHQQKLQDFDDGVTLQNATFEDLKRELNLTEYKSIEVQHCNNSFGVTFTHVNGFKLVYSGDTRPCDSLVTAGEGCDLLIHEATHEDILVEHAKASKHSTFSEAIDVGKRMRAKNIILTHFSQRYAYMVPLFDVTLPQNLGIAFDNMQVCPRTMRYLPHMIPALTSLFAIELQKFESRTAKRLLEEAEVKAKQSSKSS